MMQSRFKVGDIVECDIGDKPGELLRTGVVERVRVNSYALKKGRYQEAYVYDVKLPSGGTIMNIYQRDLKIPLTPETEQVFRDIIDYV